MRRSVGSVANDSSIGRVWSISEQEQSQLPTIQKLLETENLRDFTVQTLTSLAAELRDIIVKIRDRPDTCLSSYIPSKDAILKNLRNASIELNLALDQLELKGKTSRFYKCLLACKEYLEKAFEQHENVVEVEMSQGKQDFSHPISPDSSVHLPTSLFLTQMQECLTALTSLQQSLRHTYRILKDEDEIWTDQCNYAISTIDTMNTIIRKLCGLFDGSVQLPPTFATSNYEYMVTLYYIDEQGRKLVALLTSFRAACRFTSRQSITLREEIYVKFETLIQNNDDILHRLSMLPKQENPRKIASSHLRLVSQDA